jgi:hypothetical protein
MNMKRSLILLCCAFLASGVAAAQPQNDEPQSGIISTTDLAEPFHTRSQWSFVVSQDPPDSETPGVPGALHLCFVHGDKTICPKSEWYNNFQEASVVHPTQTSKEPLFLVRAYATSGGSGHQMGTMIWAYRPETDKFEPVFSNQTGGNHNEETRLVMDGPLAGDIIVVSPPERAPYSYGITVYRPTKSRHYVEILKYRGRTRETDGNPLAVIDSEMPAILRRLHLANPGDPLPIPLRRPSSCVTLVQRNGVENCQ